MKYNNNGKTYDVEEVNLAGAIINVNGTSITDYKTMEYITGDKMYSGMVGYSVFCDSDEICFDTFEEAYDFAMTKQKNTFSI